MEFFLILTIATVIVGVITAINSQNQTNELIEGFRNLGVLKGKTLEEIVAVVGKPQHVSTLIDGAVLYQWHSRLTPGASNYHIALVFKDNLCEGVSSESQSG